MKNSVIFNYLKDRGYKLDDDYSLLDISSNKDEVVISGSQIDLIELADYIVSVALSDNSTDHLHLDDLTLINKNSNIKNLIIEKH